MVTMMSVSSFREGGLIWDEFKHFLWMYDPHTHIPNPMPRNILYQERVGCHNIIFERNFLSFIGIQNKIWSIEREKTVWVFRVDTRIRFGLRIKDSCYGFPGWWCLILWINVPLSFIALIEIPDSKHYLCATSERFIWIIKRLKVEWNRLYMDGLYDNVNLFRDAYA